MWISAKSAAILAVAAVVLVVIALGAPYVPRPRLPALPLERRLPADKLGLALPILEAPERARAQRMLVGAPVLQGSARWAARVGTGPAATPDKEALRRLVALLKDARTVSDPRAERAEPAWVVRFARGAQRVDVMVDPAHDRLVLALDGKPVGTFAIAALHRDYSALGQTLFP